MIFLTNSLNLLSFNIRYANNKDGVNKWGSRKHLVFDIIREFGTGIFGLQEALANQIAEIEAEFPSYQRAGVGRDDGVEAGEHCPIFVNTGCIEFLESGTFWFSDTPDVPGSAHWGNSLPRIATWVYIEHKTSGQQLVVYNLHVDHISQPSRERSSELVLQHIHAHFHQLPTIIMGDFNAGESNPAVTKLHSNFRDTFRAIHPKETQVGTFHDFTGTPEPEKIDHIFVSQEFLIHSAEIIRFNQNGRYPSDHFPVTAVVGID